MDLQQVIGGRRMCRDFCGDDIPAPVLDRVLANAGRAPSAGHSQGWAFLVLEGVKQTRRFWELDAEASWLAAPDHPGLLLAPVIILPLAHRQAYVERYARTDKASASTGPDSWTTPYWVVDTAFATMLMLLTAADEQLGALFFRLHGDPRTLLDAFGVPDSFEAIGALALGWPADDSARPQPSSARAPRPRRPTADVVHRGRW